MDQTAVTGEVDKYAGITRYYALHVDGIGGKDEIVGRLLILHEDGYGIELVVAGELSNRCTGGCVGVGNSWRGRMRLLELRSERHNGHNY